MFASDLVPDVAAGSAGMRRIDLSCLIAAPIAAGCLMTLASTRAAVMVMGLWNAAACVPECLLLSQALQHSAQLRPVP